jgi:hypothetical protein
MFHGPRMSRVVAARGAAFAFYAAVLVALTWPLAASLGSRIAFTAGPCLYDLPYMAYVLAHESHALATAPSRFFDPTFYYPARHALWYGDTGFGALPFFLPSFLVTGNPTLAINLVFLVGLTLTAWALHVVVHRWTGSHLAGVVAAATLLSNRWVLWDFPPTAPTYALLQYFPLIVAATVTPAASWRDAARLVPLVVLQCLSDVAYVAAAVVAPLGVLGIVRLARPSTRAAGARLLGSLVVALLVLLPVYAGHLAVVRGGVGSTWRRILFPTALPWGPFSAGPFAVPAIAWVVIGVGSVAALAFRSPGAPWRHAALWAVVGFLLALSPVVTWGGHQLDLPLYGVARWLGVYQVIRVPWRLGAAGLIGVALLAGLGFAECSRRLPTVARVAAALGVVGLMVTAYARTLPVSIGEYPLSPAVAGDTPLGRQLALHEGPVVELPLGAPGTGRPDFQVEAMYRSIFHGRPLLNGYSSYWPPGFAERMELVARLPDADALATLRRETGLATIVVHLDEFGQSERERCYLLQRNHRTLSGCDTDPGAAERAPWLALRQAPRPDLRFVDEDHGDMVFDVASEDERGGGR